MEPEEAPLKDGDKMLDWDGHEFIASDVKASPDGYWTFDATYPDGRFIEAYGWVDGDFTHVN